MKKILAVFFVSLLIMGCPWDDDLEDQAFPSAPTKKCTAAEVEAGTSTVPCAMAPVDVATTYSGATAEVVDADVSAAGNGDTGHAYSKNNIHDYVIQFDDDLNGMPEADHVELNQIGSPTYTSLYDFISMCSSLVISGFEISDNTDGTVAVAAGTGAIKTVDSEMSPPYFFDFAGDASVSLNDEADNYVYIDYNAGTPVVAVATSLSSLNFHTHLLIGEVRRDGTSLHITNNGMRFTDFYHKMSLRLFEIYGLQRASGLAFSETGTMNIAVTAGVFYAATTRLTSAAIDTSAADTFTSYYRDGVGGWTEQTSQTAVDWTKYDDGSGTLATLGNNQYSVFHVFGLIEEGSEISIYLLYGQASYLYAQALAATVPSSIPSELSSPTASMYLGKIIIQKENTTSFTTVQYAWDQAIGFSAATDHGELAGLSDDDHPQYGALASNETITGNWVNTDNPWADNEVADDISLTNITQITNRAITSLSATNWRLFYSADGGVPVELALGSSGTYLQSNGAAAAPTWVTPAGTGDVTGVGDCTGGDCLDGSSDGGTYARLYDGDSNYVQIDVGDLAGDITVNMPTSAGTLLLDNGAGTNLTALNGENIQDDTIDDDSIDFTDVTLADFTDDVGFADISGTPAQYYFAEWVDADTIKGTAVTASSVVCTDSNGSPTACTTFGISYDVSTASGHPLNSDDSYSGIGMDGVNAGETIAQWDLVYYDTTATEWLIADADASGEWPAWGMAVAAGTDGNALTIIQKGFVRNDAWSWTPGAILYLDETTPGGMTETAPSTATDGVQPVGRAVTADIVWINIDPVFNYTRVGS